MVILAEDYQPKTLPLGAKAPDFDLPGVDGKNYKLSDFNDARILIVIFTCNHCPTAQYYEERIKKIVDDYKDKGVAVVAINPNDPNSVRLDELGWSDLSDSFDEMKIRARYRNFNFPYLYDGETESVSKAYGPVATPHAFLFDHERKLRYVGRIDDSERPQFVKVNYLRDAIDAVLKNMEPPVTTTKPVGCSVKWAGKADMVKEYMARLAKEPVSLAKADMSVMNSLRNTKNGKFRLVTFWATWCAPCIAEFDEFVKIHRMYRHRDFELITVCLNRPDEEAKVLEFLKKAQASMTNYIFASDDRESLMNQFDPEWPGAVPYTVLIHPDGRIIYRESGSIDPLALRRKIVSSMNELKPW